MRQMMKMSKKYQTILFMQSSRRAVLLRRAFLKKRAAVSTISGAWGQYRMSPAFARRQRAVLTIQSIVRTHILRRRFIAQRTAAPVIQKLYRRRLVRLSKAAVEVQRIARGLLARRARALRMNALVTMQSHWRGVQARSKCGRRIRLVRQRLQAATQAVEEHRRIGNRTRSALNILLTSKQVADMTQACITLKSVTQVLPLCCVDAVDEDAIPVLYGLMRDCNRSEPHLALVRLCLSILLNIADNPVTHATVFTPRETVSEVLSTLLHDYHSDPIICQLSVSLLLKACLPTRESHKSSFLNSKYYQVQNHHDSKSFIEQLSSNAEVMSRLKGILRLKQRKYSLVAKSLKDSDLKKIEAMKAEGKEEKKAVKRRRASKQPVKTIETRSVIMYQKKVKNATQLKQCVIFLNRLMGRVSKHRK